MSTKALLREEQMMEYYNWCKIMEHNVNSIMDPMKGVSLLLLII